MFDRKVGFALSLAIMTLTLTLKLGHPYTKAFKLYTSMCEMFGCDVVLSCLYFGFVHTFFVFFYKFIVIITLLLNYEIGFKKN